MKLFQIRIESHSAFKIVIIPKIHLPENRLSLKMIEVQDLRTPRNLRDNFKYE